nr:hypothetical protein [Tanacetum cinerariifolium]
MLNKDNYISWSSRIIQYARSRPNGKMIVDSIENGPYVRRMIATPGEPDLHVLVPESFHEQTDKEITENDIKRMDADDQAIQTILLGLPEDVYAADKKAKLFNEWEKFTSTDEESIESYYHHFMQLINDLKRNKHFPENIAANLKFLNNLQPEWKRHVTIFCQTKNLHEADFTQIYNFLKMNQDENFMQPPMTSLEDIYDPTEAMNAALILFAKAFQLSAPTNNNQRTSSNPCSRQIAQSVMNMGIANQSGTGNIVAVRAEGTGIENQASMVHSGGTLETSSAPNEEIRVHQETVYRNLVDQVAQNLHEADFTQIYNFLKMNQDKVNKLKAERLAKTHDPLALIAHSQNSYNFPATHNDQSSFSTHLQQSFPINNKYNPQPSLNQNFMQPPMTSLEDINDPTEAMNAVLILFAKAFQLTAPTNNNQITSSNPCNRQIAQPGMNMYQDRQIQNVGGNGGNQFGQVVHNQQGYNAWQNGGIQVAHNADQNAGVQNGGNQNGLVVIPRITNQNGTGNIVVARAEGTGNGNQARLSCSLLNRKKQGFNFKKKNLTSWLLQLDKAPVYDTDSSAKVQLNDNCYDNKIFNMFTQEEQYTDLLEPILEPQLVPQNDNHVTSVAPSMVQSGGTVETSSAPNEETRTHQETVYRNLNDQVAQEISSLNKQLSKEKSTISSLMEEKKRLKHDFKTQEDRFLDKEVDLEAKIKDLEYILFKRDQTVQTMHMLNPKPNSFYYPYQKMVLGYPNPSYLKKAQLKLQSLYNVEARVQNFKIQFLQEAVKFVRDFKSLAKEADESLDKQKSLELKIEWLFKASVSHDIMSIVQNGFVDVPSDLQTELDRTKEKLELCITKKEKEYVVLWNNWYTKCKECKYDKISYDKAYNGMQQKVERLQAQLRDLK